MSANVGKTEFYIPQYCYNTKECVKLAKQHLKEYYPKGTKISVYFEERPSPEWEEQWWKKTSCLRKESFKQWVSRTYNLNELLQYAKRCGWKIDDDVTYLEKI